MDRLIFFANYLANPTSPSNNPAPRGLPIRDSPAATPTPRLPCRDHGERVKISVADPFSYFWIIWTTATAFSKIEGWEGCGWDTRGWDTRFAILNYDPKPKSDPKSNPKSEGVRV